MNKPMMKSELNDARPTKDVGGRPKKTVAYILEAAEKRLLEALVDDAIKGTPEERRALLDELSARRAAAAK